MGFSQSRLKIPALQASVNKLICCRTISSAAKPATSNCDVRVTMASRPLQRIQAAIAARRHVIGRQTRSQIAEDFSLSQMISAAMVARTIPSPASGNFSASGLPSGRRRSSHPGMTEQYGFKVLRTTADIHLLEVIVPTRRGDLPLEFALKLDVRQTQKKSYGARRSVSGEFMP